MFQTIVILLMSFFVLCTNAANLGLSSVVTTLAVANVRQTVTATELNAYDLIIQNPSSNTDSIFLGGNDVTISGSTQGIELVPGATISLSASGDFGDGRLLKSSKIYIVSGGTAVPVVVSYIKH